IDDARIVMRDEGKSEGLRSSGDDRLLEADALLAVLTLYLDLIRRGKASISLDDRHLALLSETAEAAGQPLDDSVLPITQLSDVDIWRREGDAMTGHFFGLG